MKQRRTRDGVVMIHERTRAARLLNGRFAEAERAARVNTSFDRSRGGGVLKACVYGRERARRLGCAKCVLERTRAALEQRARCVVAHPKVAPRDILEWQIVLAKLRPRSGGRQHRIEKLGQRAVPHCHLEPVRPLVDVRDQLIHVVVHNVRVVKGKVVAKPAAQTSAAAPP